MPAFSASVRMPAKAVSVNADFLVFLINKKSAQTDSETSSGRGSVLFRLSDGSIDGSLTVMGADSAGVGVQILRGWGADSAGVQILRGCRFCGGRCGKSCFFQIAEPVEECAFCEARKYGLERHVLTCCIARQSWKCWGNTRPGRSRYRTNSKEPSWALMQWKISMPQSSKQYS
jgi:hypothetical protein